jgi:hypothetical protein
LLQFCSEPFFFPSPLQNPKDYNRQSITLPVVLYGRKTWSLTLRGDHRLRVFENRVLRRIFGPKREEVAEAGKDCIMRSFITCGL